MKMEFSNHTLKLNSLFLILILWHKRSSFLSISNMMIIRLRRLKIQSKTLHNRWKKQNKKLGKKKSWTLKSSKSQISRTYYRKWGQRIRMWWNYLVYSFLNLISIFMAKLNNQQVNVSNYCNYFLLKWSNMNFYSMPRNFLRMALLLWREILKIKSFHTPIIWIISLQMRFTFDMDNSILINTLMA